MDNSTHAPDAAPAPQLSSNSRLALTSAEALLPQAARISVKGILFDRVANRVVESSPIQIGDGAVSFATETGRGGAFSLDLPHDGDWLIAPNFQTDGATAYSFKPIVVKVQGRTNAGQLDVEGNAAANAAMLRTYVRNVLISCENIFDERMAAYQAQTGVPPTEDQVRQETAYVADLLKSALKHVVNPVNPTPGPVVQSHIMCSTCRLKYANNQTLLQKCLSLPHPCVG